MSGSTRKLHASDRFNGKDLGDEYLFYDRNSDRVHVLNGSARAIYLLCDGQTSEDDVATAFAAMCDVDAGTARNDALDTIRRLLDLGVIRLD